MLAGDDPRTFLFREKRKWAPKQTAKNLMDAGRHNVRIAQHDPDPARRLIALQRARKLAGEYQAMAQSPRPKDPPLSMETRREQQKAKNQ